jgi:single-stranded-DNA-specific exonuclease
MMPARWVFPRLDARAAAQLAGALSIGSPAAQALCRRGYGDAESARRFLRASLDDLNDPLLMRDMARAAERLECAIRRREKILIFGDYDVDGTTSVALLMKTIGLAGGAATWHIPNRLTDGYGMRVESIEKAAAEGVRLIVSVDTGIRAAEPVRRAAELGVDLIVTDHHLPEAELPPAMAVLNPNRPDCQYPEKNLCGAGVAFKLALALLARLGWEGERLRRVSDSFLKIVALATIADVVPLTGENRIITKHGLAGLGEVRNPGLRALLDVAGIKPGEAPAARQVAFQVGPRMNAAGRMDTAREVVELLLTPDAAVARELAGRLDQRNAERQQVELEIRQACEAEPMNEASCALVYYREEWHRGVLGIVASRLVERYHRPVFVLGRSEEGLAQGSGRSVAGFHLLDALESMRELFVRFGGHRAAAGVTLETARVAEFRERFHQCAAACLKPEDFAARLELDGVVELPEIDEAAANDVFAMAPFGYGNQAPLFAALDVEVAAPPSIFAEKHLRVAFTQGGRKLPLTAWSWGARAGEFTPGARMDVAFSLDEDARSAARGYPGWRATLRDVRAPAPRD